VIVMARSGALAETGFLKQEAIPLKSFLKARMGQLYAERGRAGR